VEADGAVPRARVWVQDEGPGPPPGEADHVFEPFWRGAASGEVSGTGLGLAIVRATAERHGGRATVSGARFAIELPAAAGDGGRSHDSFKEEGYKP
jgi:two-component system OmpR family sensor kinase